MKFHPSVVHQNGIVSVTMQASFIGDPTDASDQQRIQAYGDPKVNIGGLFADPADPAFQFTFPASEVYSGITTDIQNHTARFMTTLPPIPPHAGNYAFYVPQPTSTPAQGSLDCIVTAPVRAATIWAAAIDTRVSAAMAILRAKTPAQLTTLPDTAV